MKRRGQLPASPEAPHLGRVIVGCNHHGCCRRGGRGGRSAALGGRGATEQHGVCSRAGGSCGAGRQAWEAGGGSSGRSSGLFLAAGSSAAWGQGAAEAGACRQAGQAAAGGGAAGQAGEAAGRLGLGAVGLDSSGHGAGGHSSGKRVHVLLSGLGGGG